MCRGSFFFLDPAEFSYTSAVAKNVATLPSMQRRDDAATARYGTIADVERIIVLCARRAGCKRCECTSTRPWDE